MAVVHKASAAAESIDMMDMTGEFGMTDMTDEFDSVALRGENARVKARRLSA